MNNNDENTRAFLRIAAPLCLVMAPIGFGMFVYAYFRDVKNGLDPNISEPIVAFPFIALIIGFIVAIRYCKHELGFFQGKNGKKRL